MVGQSNYVFDWLVHSMGIADRQVPGRNTIEQEF